MDRRSKWHEECNSEHQPCQQGGEDPEDINEVDWLDELKQVVLIADQRSEGTYGADEPLSEPNLDVMPKFEAGGITRGIVAREGRLR